MPGASGLKMFDLSPYAIGGATLAVAVASALVWTAARRLHGLPAVARTGPR